MKLTYQDLLEKMTNMEMLAIPPEKGEMGGNFSSYDRNSSYDPSTDTYSQWGANRDCDGYIRMEKDRLVAFEMEGPGVIWRIWSANPQEGHIRIYTENEQTEKMDMPFRKLFERYAYDESRVEWPANFPELMPILSRGRNRFIPIPFNHYCKVTLNPGWGEFYHITYTKFPSCVELPEYSLDMEIEAQTALAVLDRKFYLRGKEAYEANQLENTLIENLTLNCEAGEQKILYQSDKSLAISGIWLLADEKQCAWEDLEKLRMEIYWDGEKEKSVSCSLASFFGVIKESCEYRSWPVSKTERECAAFWYMPCKSVIIKIINNHNIKLRLDFRIRYKYIPLDEAEQLMRFHAKEHGTEFAYLERERFEKSGDRWPDWPVLLCKGKGRFCGLHLVVDNHFVKPENEAEEWWYGIADKKTIDWWWGEGDEKFFVDGEKFPSSFGTGSEDYIGYAWAAEPPHVYFDSAYAVQNAVPLDGNGNTSLLRFHICDAIPFQNQFEGFLEKYNDNGWSVNATCEYTVTPFWYVLHDGNQVDPYQ